MNDKRKTKAQLIGELEVLREQVAELEVLREQVAELEVLREQVAELEVLREQVAELEVLRKQVAEHEVLRKQVAEHEVLRKQVAEHEVLRERVAELEQGPTRSADEPAPADGSPDPPTQRETIFRALAENTTAHISVMQGDQYLYANQAFLDYYEIDPEDLRCTTPEDLMQGLISPQMVQEVAPAAEAAMAQGETQFNFDMQYLDGTWLQTNVTVVDIDGKPTFVIMAFDITELKRAQREMYRADKMAALGQIVAGVAHEINNPNNFIHFNLPILRRYLEAMEPLLEQRLAADPSLEILGLPYAEFLQDVYRLIANMEQGSERITSIVADLKSYVRSDEENGRKAAPLRTVVDRVMTLIGKQVRKMVKHLDVEVAEGLPLVEMNPCKLEQVLINLLINAGHAADKEDARVGISVLRSTRREGWVELRVEDNGAGMPPDTLDRIFEPFFTSKSRDQGTGLGLSIAHRIIEEHGGTIDVESTLGEGTCFTVLLPPAASPEALPAFGHVPPG
jgi:PAS domain S-box-containing protein